MHCGVDLAVFDPQPALDPDDSDRPLRVLCVARLARVKGHTVLLDAIAQLADQGVPIAPPRSLAIEPTRQGLEQRAARLSVDDRVSFTGAVGHDAIRAHYAKADVFCLTSFAEGVPVVLMEAMAMRIPVIASQVMGVSELVEDGKSGILVRPARPDLVADALRRLQASSELREYMGSAGREAVRREFDVHGSARQLAQLFSSHATSINAERRSSARWISRLGPQWWARRPPRNIRPPQGALVHRRAAGDESSRVVPSSARTLGFH